MAKLSGQALLLGLFLILQCILRLDALKSPRGVRGYSRSGESRSGLNLGRDLIEERKKEEEKDKAKTQDGKDEELNVESAFEEDEDDKDDKNQDEDVVAETEEPTVPPTAEPTSEPTPKGEPDDEDTEPPTAEPTSAPADEEPTEEPDDKDTEPPTDQDPTDPPTDENGTQEEGSNPVEVPTGAPATNITVPDIDPATSVTRPGEMYIIDLAPFTIRVDYEEPITEDPGIEDYLFNEMQRGGAYNLQEVNLEMIVAEVNGRRLLNQELSYSGAATFNGRPIYEEEEVHRFQASILGNEEAVSAVIAASLGKNPSNFAVSSIVMEADAVQPESGGSTTGGSDSSDEDDELSTTGLVIVIVAGCIGAISLTIIFLVGISKPKPPKPYGGGANRSLALSTKQVSPTEEAKADLNKTFETEDDQVHEEFAQNMEKHDFEGSWQAGPVNMQASMGRGFYHERGPNEDRPSEDDSTDPEELKRELGEQLSELQASVKAAREKTQRLLAESKKN